MEGVNVSVFLYGATGSGKAHTMEGKGADAGIVPLFSDNLFNVLEEKRYQNPSFQFSIRIRFVEILDEEAQDLLQSGGGASFPARNVTTNEWEGPQVQGVQWVPVPSAAQLNDFFKGGCRNKTSRSNEFGRMRDKAAQLFQIEVKQSMLNAATGENQVIVSRVNILSTPGCEVLNEDPEALRAKQGADLNKGILTLSSLLRDLAATPHGDYANYDNSLLTQLSRDIFGGNSLCVGIFCLQYGDAVGSALSLRAL